jgi:U3 small nucleolar ribonucleoprotein protein IMP4
MLRRQARLRREYLYRKSLEDKRKSIQDKKDRLKKSLDNNLPIQTDLKRDALGLQKKLDWDDQGPQVAATVGDESGGAAATHEDDEYRWAGVEDPKVLLFIIAQM